MLTIPLRAFSCWSSLALGTALSLVLRWHYIRFGRTLANRRTLARTFPFIALTTLLVITVVKSSLALSLGLVGALSIVRFRTPIKEPEELAYLFLAIAIGLGLGANQILTTLIAAPAILIAIGILSTQTRGREENLFLNVTVPGGAKGTEWFDQLNTAICQHVELADVRRMDVSESELQVSYFVHCKDNESLAATLHEIQQVFPQASVCFVEQQNYLGG